MFYARDSDGGERPLEYDLILAPHADPRQIALEIEGARKLAVNAQGDLEIAADGGTLLQKRPRAVQDGREIPARYRVNGMQVRLALGAYDASKPLMIDPEVVATGPALAYATFFGGALNDDANSIVADAAGNVYVAGQTASPNFPPPPLATLGYSVAKEATDVFVTKFDPTGKTVLMSVLLGSMGADNCRNVAVDSAGNIYLVGQAGGQGFPLMNALQKTEATNANGFVAKLDSSGNLVFSTYLGGTVSPPGLGPNGNTIDISTDVQTIAFDSQGDVWVSGWTVATDFPVTLGPQPDPAGYAYAFVTGFSPTGKLVSSFVFNGGYYPALTLVTAIAIDNSGNIVVAGSTTGGLPVTQGVVQPQYGGGTADAFVAKVNPQGSASN